MKIFKRKDEALERFKMIELRNEDKRKFNKER